MPPFLRNKVLQSPQDLVKTLLITSDSVSFPSHPFLSEGLRRDSVKKGRKFPQVTLLVSSTPGPGLVHSSVYTSLPGMCRCPKYFKDDIANIQIKRNRKKKKTSSQAASGWWPLAVLQGRVLCE